MGGMQSWESHVPTIEAARAGEGGALEALIAVVWPHAYRIALSILQHPMAAEDAAQESCARVVAAIGGLRSSEAFGVWFYRLVVREALRIERHIPEHEPLDTRLLASASALTDALIRIDILRALGALPARQRAVVALHHYAGLNSREIGEILATPEGTVRYQLAVARRRLESLLAAHRPYPRIEGLFDAG
jgi:RNA polymerase sigma-70 factor (ECF subfamily)